ncbi:MAG TPA: hypothetical protein VNH11_08320 [Pirellulales bacterium]|nr:hypothetical protein [Pirellulales bacterium]
MNVYFLVEGKRTERKVYPAWLGHLLPELRQVAQPQDAVENNYFIISGFGYPSMLHDHLPNAVADVNKFDRYSHLVVCLDAEELTINDRRTEVIEFSKQRRCRLLRAELLVIVQNRCLETWFLGNRKIVSRSPQNQALGRYLAFFDVTRDDPEQMGVYRALSAMPVFTADTLKRFSPSAASVTAKHALDT